MIGTSSAPPRASRRSSRIFRRNRRAVGATIAAVIAITAGGLVATSESAAAADVSSFNAGNLISDTVFYDGAATKQASIQTLLDQKGAGCQAVGSLLCLNDISVTISKSAGDQYCNPIGSQSHVSAARVFAVVGSACSINPAVLVVLVQKEQSLVTRGTPSALAYSHATGYNCPDSAKCSTGTAGFYTQVYHAAKQFQRYRLNSSSYNFRSGRYNTILYHPASAKNCGSSKVFIENSATAGLYNYTPYQPNRAALANVYGSGDSCSSYGNRNFWRYFNDWFGNTGNLLKASSFEGSIKHWSFGSHVVEALHGTAASAVSAAEAGQYYVGAHTSVAGQTVRQTVAKKAKVGHTYTGSIWLRSAAPGTTFSGKLVVWALGGHTESTTVPFAVGNTWTEVSGDLTVHKSHHTELRLQAYLGTTGTDLQLDAANLAPQAPQPSRGPVALASPSFESGIQGWTFTNGAINRKVYTDVTTAHSGNNYLALNTATSGHSARLSVSRAPTRGEAYTAQVWMRSASSTTPYTGKLVLWALGGTSEEAVTAFSVDSTWTPVIVSLPVTRTGHTKLRIETVLSSTGSDLDIDDVSLTANLLTNGSFESGVVGLAASNGTATVASVPNDILVQGPIAGNRNAEFSVPDANDSVAMNASRRLRVGETYTASVWMRTAEPGTTFSGKLALWATGGASENSVTTITGLTSDWTLEQVQLTITDVTNNRLKVEVYSNAPGVQVLLDDAVLS